MLYLVTISFTMYQGLCKHSRSQVNPLTVGFKMLVTYLQTFGQVCSRSPLRAALPTPKTEKWRVCRVQDVHNCVQADGMGGRQPMQPLVESGVITPFRAWRCRERHGWVGRLRRCTPPPRPTTPTLSPTQVQPQTRGSGFARAT